MQKTTRPSVQRCIFQDQYQAHRMRVWRQGAGDGGKWEWRSGVKEKNKTKNNVKGGFEQNNDDSIISSIVCIWDKNK